MALDILNEGDFKIDFFYEQENLNNEESCLLEERYNTPFNNSNACIATSDNERIVYLINTCSSHLKINIKK